MATRRKYKQPQGYRTGGRVTFDDIVIPDTADASSAPTVSPEAESLAEDDPLMKALNAQKRAEELQRQAPRQPTEHERFVDSLPVSDRKKSFLKANPALIRDDVAPVVGRVHAEGIRLGIADDSDEMEKFIVERTIQHFERAEHQRQLSSASARPTEENRVTHQAVADLQHEADEVAAVDRPAPQPAPSPKPRSRVSVSAPVSREVPAMAGQRQRDDNTLTLEERMIARNSFTDPNVSDAQKEYLYLQNKKKLAQMRRDGSYSEQRDG